MGVDALLHLSIELVKQNKIRMEYEEFYDKASFGQKAILDKLSVIYEENGQYLYPDYIRLALEDMETLGASFDYDFDGTLFDFKFLGNGK